MTGRIETVGQSHPRIVIEGFKIDFGLHQNGGCTGFSGIQILYDTFKKKIGFGYFTNHA
jgi:hypothetical protein